MPKEGETEEEEYRKNTDPAGFRTDPGWRKVLYPAGIYFYGLFSYNDRQRQNVTERKNRTWQSWEGSSCSG